MKITLCGSLSTEQGWNDLNTAGKTLEALGHTVLYPTKETSTDYINLPPEKFAPRKNFFMWEHLNKVAESDAILVTNGEKKGIPGYIGSNTLLEMGVAMFLKKKIFLLNPVSSSLPAQEEILGMLPTILHGNLENLA